MADVVTGDAVVVEVQIAQLPVRAVGAVIDVTVIFSLYILGLILALATLRELDDALVDATRIGDHHQQQARRRQLHDLDMPDAR